MSRRTWRLSLDMGFLIAIAIVTLATLTAVARGLDALRDLVHEGP